MLPSIWNYWKERVDKHKGFLLHKYPYSDSSYICKVFTEEMGLVTLIAKGAKRPKSPLGARLLPAMLGDWVFKVKRNSEMYTLREVVSLQDFSPLTEQPLQAAQLAFLHEIILKTMGVELSHKGVFQALWAGQIWLGQENRSSIDQIRLSTRFLIKIIEELGFAINHQNCGSCGQTILGTGVKLNFQDGTFIGSCCWLEKAPESHLALAQMLSLGRCPINQYTACEEVLLAYIETHLGHLLHLRSYDILTELRVWKNKS